MNVGMGENPVRECVACHGLDGAGRVGGSFPNLTMQSPAYLYTALKAYASGQRQSGVMWPIAASLSDEEMRALATRFGSGAPKKSHGDEDESGVALEKHGENVANGVGPGGKPSTDTVVGVVTPMRERCTSCHIRDVYLDRVIPRIDGQNAGYLRSQMRAFRRGGRGDTTSYNPMVADSHNLTDADIVGLGAYYEGRIPGAKIK